MPSHRDTVESDAHSPNVDKKAKKKKDKKDRKRSQEHRKSR
mgnify:CR=1 FL=1